MSSLTPDGKHRLISDVVKKLKWDKPKDQTDEEQLLARYRTIVQAVSVGARSIRDAELAAKRLPDRRALNQLNIKVFRDKFNEFSKDELVNLMALMHAKKVDDDLDTFGS